MSADPCETRGPQTADRYLDCKGLACPMPIVRVSQAVKQMSGGQTLLIEAADPAFRSDLEAWVGTMGHELLEFTEGAVQRAVIRKAGHPGEER